MAPSRTAGRLTMRHFDWKYGIIFFAGMVLPLAALAALLL
jgi:hypothetical protein